MSQHSFSIPNEAGANFRADVNTALQALVSHSSGNSAPTTTYAYQAWIDTSGSYPILKFRNAANSAWISMGRTDQANFGLDRPYSGNSAPATTYPYLYWVDTNLSYAVLKIRNAGDTAWITLGRLDVDNFAMLPLAGGTLSGPLLFSNTDYTKVPVGTTAQRPGSPSNGMLRYNTDLTQFEGYSNSAWAPVGGGGFVVTSAQTVSAGGTISSSTTDQRQMRPVIGNTTPTSASLTPFGSSGGWKDGTEILLTGTSDSASVILTFNDAAKGLVGNFTEIELTKYKSVMCVYNQTLDRWVVTQGLA